MLCWPFFGNQQMDYRYSCNEWGIGMEISNDVKRDEVERLVRELMDGEKGKKMKNKVMVWKKLAEEATGPHGSSSKNLDSTIGTPISSEAVIVDVDMKPSETMQVTGGLLDVVIASLLSALRRS